jgi:hypothetical protein
MEVLERMYVFVLVVLAALLVIARLKLINTLFLSPWPPT